MKSVTIQDLQACYADATRKKGIIDLVTSLRMGDALKLKDLDSYFSNPLWIQSNQASGHCKLKHKVTQVVIEYQNHGDETVASHIQDQIKNQAQEHLNILCNKVFKYSTHNWKNEPDFQQALANYKALKHNRQA